MLKSPRAAAALLRLALEELCEQLECKGKNLQEYIDFLITEQKLSSEVEKAMNAVRVVGNKAVHAGTIDLYDNTEIAEYLFGLINFIGKELITLPNERKDFYTKLPSIKKQKNTR